jgi:hypothetical protein
MFSVKGFQNNVPNNCILFMGGTWAKVEMGSIYP